MNRAILNYLDRERPMSIDTEKTTAPHGYLCNYQTGERIRPATDEEQFDSQEAAQYDGGAGVIEVDGVSCFVEG